MTEVSQPSARPAQASARAGDAVATGLARRGAAALILGAAGLALVFLVSPTGVIWYGALVAVVGAGQLPEFRRSSARGQPWMQAAVALLYVVLGLALIVLPQAAGGLERVIAALFALSGLSRLLWAVSWPRPLAAWGAGAGVAAILVGLVLLVVWPPSVLWFLGAAVALDLAVYGLASIGLSRALRA